jgi:hypothetical protein
MANIILHKKQGRITTKLKYGVKMQKNELNAHINRHTSILLDHPKEFYNSLPDCIKNFGK